MQVLVTGGAGFIGSHVVDALVRSGHRVTVLDDLSTGHAEAVHPSAQLVRCDFSDGAVLRDLFNRGGIEAVIHLAASIEAGESLRFPERFFANNAGRTLLMLETVLDLGLTRFVFASTAAVYGDTGPAPVDEDHLLAPVSPYGHSKVMVEEALRWLHRQRGLGCAILRCFNAAGCGPALGEDHNPETHLIPLALDSVLGGRGGLDLFGTSHPTKDGTCVRDYVHVLDIAEAFKHALERVEPGSWGIWNIGSGEGRSVKEVLEAVRRVTGAPLAVTELPARPGDPPEVVADISRARLDLNWEPRCSELEPMVRSAWEWRRRHAGGPPATENQR